MNFEIDGYTVLLQNKKRTCNTKYGLNGLMTRNTTKCREHCDRNSGCKYMFLNDGGGCHLYSSCIDKRTAEWYGSTYQKKGNRISLLSYLTNL